MRSKFSEVWSNQRLNRSNISEPPNAFHNILIQMFPRLRYEGVSKSFQRESAMLTFVIDHCYSLLFSLVWFQCFCHSWKHCWNFLKSHVGWLLIVLEFQDHPGNDIFITVISFLKTRINHIGPNQTSKESGRPQPCFYWQRNAYAYAYVHLWSAKAQISWRSTTSSSPSSEFTLQQA